MLLFCTLFTWFVQTYYWKEMSLWDMLNAQYASVPLQVYMQIESSFYQSDKAWVRDLHQSRNPLWTLLCNIWTNLVCTSWEMQLHVRSMQPARPVIAAYFSEVISSYVRRPNHYLISKWMQHIAFNISELICISRLISMFANATPSCTKCYFWLKHSIV